MRAFRATQTFSVSKRRLEFSHQPACGADRHQSAAAPTTPWRVAESVDGSDGDTLRSGRASLAKHFLPKHYPHSVSPQYLRFVSWQAAQMVVSSAAGVLSMQSLLYAIGVGAGSIPMAAALNWVLKDGIGQLGAIWFGSWAGSRFDADPKRFRMLGCVAQDAANVLEALTPLAPHLFLPLASLANCSKNITWFAASTTRAAIHRALCRAENLADLTGKAVSQSIAASLAGTALGIGMSSALAALAPATAVVAVGTGASAAVAASVAVAGPAPVAVLAALVPLAAAHWFLCYKSLGAQVVECIVLNSSCTIQLFFCALEKSSQCRCRSIRSTRSALSGTRSRFSSTVPRHRHAHSPCRPTTLRRSRCLWACAVTSRRCPCACMRTRVSTRRLPTRRRCAAQSTRVGSAHGDTASV